MYSELLSHESHESTDLASLFTGLINLCVNQAASDEQYSLAKLIDSLFNKSIESNPSTYKYCRKFTNVRLRFLVSSPTLKRRTSKSPKKVKKQEKKNSKAKKNILEKSVSVPSPKTPKKASSSRPSSKSSKKSKDTQISRPSTSSGIFTEPVDETNLSSSDFASQDEVLLNLLKAIELSNDDLATIVLCRLIQGYVTYCKSVAAQRRLRRMAKLDAANYFLRTMRAQISEPNPSPYKIMAIDALASALLSISLKDRKFTLKVRISGMLTLLFNRVMEIERLWSTITLLRLLCRCVRSPRNAQLMGKEKHFAERFVAMLSAFNAIECNEGDNVSTLKMARLVEVLFFVSKNKKNKSLLLDQGVCAVLKTIFEVHFDRRSVEATHLEIALISVACLRQFSRTKKGKDHLMTLNTLAICDDAIRKISDDRKRLANKPKVLAPFMQLQDSLCALCMRCLPQVPFPMPLNVPFPLSFPLPSPPKAAVARNLRSSASKSPQKVTSLKAKLFSFTKSSEADSAIDDASPSSDDDGVEEEDEALLYFNSSGGLNNSFLDASDDIEMAISEDDDDPTSSSNTPNKYRTISQSSGSSTPSKANQNNSLGIKYSHQTPNQYHTMFSEFEEGAMSQGSLSPKHRRIAHSERLSEATFEERTKSVGVFNKVAFPELANPDIELEQQPLLQNPESMKEMIVQELTRSQLQNNFASKVVFDLDKLITTYKSESSPGDLNNLDLSRIGKLNIEENHLHFESRFEGGNLRRAIQVSDNHYQLILSPDINQTRSHYQWFYFEISNNIANIPYTFEIINCLKNTSMFSHGMQPVLFSVTEAKNGRPGWVRAGSSVCYFRNLYTSQAENGKDGKSSGKKAKKNSKVENESNNENASPNGETKSFYSIRFTLKFRHTADVCYVAYHYPYTYSYLQGNLERYLTTYSSSSSVYLRQDRLTTTLAGNSVPMLTITGPGTARDLEERDVILFTARVHPGESNASWIMHGILEFLLSNLHEASELRDMFVFKLIPMLNPDGVINGSHRCSLAGVDLNRVWDRPSRLLHPTVYHTKGIAQYMCDVLKKPPLVFIDLHGHSRRPNIFMFGNNPEESWRQVDHSMENNFQFMVLPEILDQTSPAFSLKDCRFGITKAKEPSARVVLWRQFKLERAYTMESTYCGFGSGEYAGNQIGIAELKEMGARLCHALLPLKQYLTGQVDQTLIESRTDDPLDLIDSNKEPSKKKVSFNKSASLGSLNN